MAALYVAALEAALSLHREENDDGTPSRAPTPTRDVAAPPAAAPPADTWHAALAEAGDRLLVGLRRCGRRSRRLVVLLQYAACISFTVLMLSSEAALALYFTWPPPDTYEDEPPPHEPTFLGDRTPLGLLLLPSGVDAPLNHGLAGALALLGVGVTLFLFCAWSLDRWQSVIARDVFWYFGMRPAATDTGSLAFNSAMLCRVAVMLTYNLDLLLLAPDKDGGSTPQTIFYCVFAKRSRLKAPEMRPRCTRDAPEMRPGRHAAAPRRRCSATTGTC